MQQNLISAFRHHMRGNARPAFYFAQGYSGRNAWPEKAHGIAVEALARARRDVAEGKKRYPPSLPKFGAGWREESDRLRLVGRVVPDCGGRDGIWSRREDTGWYTDPFGECFRDGTGLCWGVVYQLPGRRGESRFVAGYQFGGCDGGPSLDLSRVFVEPRGEYRADATDLDAARDAAFHADAMARKAAEEEREYQTAWRAGSRYLAEGETIDAAREELREILAERRKVKGAGEYPALCRALRSRVADLWQQIQDARETRKTLAEGDAPNLYFWKGDKRLQDAFCEGAGLSAFPA